jgi:hypothetical protein
MKRTENEMMSNQSPETTNQPAFNRSKSSEYAAHIQEAMRHGELRSWEYPVAMTIMRALSQGLDEEAWKLEQKRSIEALTQKSPDEKTPHTESANRYEQMVLRFKDQHLWPW